MHITATYSNALLIAILPHVSDFSKKLELPIPQPITAAQVLKFSPNPYKRHLAGSVVLTNHYWFFFDEHGFVSSFTSATNWFSEQEDLVANLPRYLGKTRMTTNEIVAFAKEKLLKLGYSPEVTRTDTTPEITGPYNPDLGGHISYCRVKWQPIKDFNSDGHSEVRVEINTQEKRVVGLYLSFARTNTVATPLKIDVEPELESEFRKRTKATMFLRTNAPPRLPRKPLGVN